MTNYSLNNINNNNYFKMDSLSNPEAILHNMTGKEVHHTSKKAIASALMGKPANYIKAETNKEKVQENLKTHSKAIEEAAKKYNVDPALIKAVMTYESGGKTTAISPTGACGVMQLTSWIYDPRPSSPLKGAVNPFNPKEAIDRGTEFLAYLQKVYPNNTAKVLAAYNQGEPVVNAAIRQAKTQGGNWVDYLPLEGKKYVKNVGDIYRSSPSPIKRGVDFTPKQEILLGNTSPDNPFNFDKLLGQRA